MFRTEYVKKVYADLQKNNANEPEFLQAAQEILESLELIVEKRPDIEKNRIGMSLGGVVYQHEGGRIIRKLLAETFYRTLPLHFPVLQEIGQHLQKVGFTTAEEPGNPHADVWRSLVKRITIVIEERNEVFLQFFGDDIFIQFLHQNIAGILVNLDHAVDFAVDVLLEHVLDSHSCFSL